MIRRFNDSFVISHFLGSIFEELARLFLFDLLTQKFHKKDPQKIFIEANNVQCKVRSLFLAIANKKKTNDGKLAPN